MAQRFKPAAIKVDDGIEFAGKVMGRWVYENGIEIGFSRRGAPIDDALLVTLNGRLRPGFLNTGSYYSRKGGAKLKRGGVLKTRGAPTLNETGKTYGFCSRTRFSSELPGAEAGRNRYRRMPLRSGWVRWNGTQGGLQVRNQVCALICGKLKLVLLTLHLGIWVGGADKVYR